jgi:hypothetical protein
MRFRALALLVIVSSVLLIAPREANGKNWKGIVPLHSTRADVERLLGQPVGEDSDYEVEGARVQFAYAERGCQEGIPGGWKVPPDTVVSITVSTLSETKVADLLVKDRSYEKIFKVHSTEVDYVDALEGIRFTTDNGLVKSVTYFASGSDDRQLRCGEFKYAAPVTAAAKNRFEQVTYDSYGPIPFPDAKAKLESFAGQLQSMNGTTPHFRGFVIVYAGRSAHEAEASKVVECSRDYLVRELKMDPNTIVVTDGGYRNEFIVELYIMPTDAYPPLLKPTVSRRQIEILPGTFSPCSPE